jgi:CRP-like cAMP-binding protein
MSLLDQEPRSADAVSNGESILLKIDQDGFFELMASNSEIIKQIMKMLTKRLRQTNKKLTDSLK